MTTVVNGTATAALTTERDDGLPEIRRPRAMAPQDARELSKLFFDRLRHLEEGTRAHQYARNTLIEMNMSMVRYVARRYRHRGDDMDDIVQVGTIGLIKAIDRFDVSRAVEFSTFAVPYILGEIRRFFRDTGWAVHVPRRLQELRTELAKAKEELHAGLDRDPTVPELAAHLRLPEDEVIEGLVAANGYAADSLDTPLDPDPLGRRRALADVLGEEDRALEAVEDLHTLAPLLRQLAPRERRIIELRFGQEMTQSQIGAEIGVSQMHVSRLLNHTLTRLRSGMLADRPPEAAPSPGP
ncbi:MULTISPECIES: RNA polymerase sigma factor SigF [unclassified Streptomyces]|uniref:RNA polymerase sigma factor SigF n=1 Tax=unclassified Streptomyces TaxID=2593676 RepID=UPI0003604765|nr:MULTISPECIES: RNA polymerase sigma factor SigF [unclassified Streptomyces]MYT29910.1 SigB/SigF/SigG family RNA polymerase sigma factor [Streptomyces sp. SID8354]